MKEIVTIIHCDWCKKKLNTPADKFNNVTVNEANFEICVACCNEIFEKLRSKDEKKQEEN
jgi:hypothetical protein